MKCLTYVSPSGAGGRKNLRIRARGAAKVLLHAQRSLHADYSISLLHRSIDINKEELSLVAVGVVRNCVGPIARD